MLRNPKYVGEFSYGARKWQRHPTTRQRVARARQEADVLREQRPELAIIDRATWDAVQVRLAEHAEKYKGRAIPRQKTSYLHGLLRCRFCGALMQISSGSNHSYYRCVANRKRGTCSNRLSVREALTRRRVLEAIEGAIASPAAAAPLILMEVDGDRSPMVAEMRADFEAQARVERVALDDLRAHADEPIQLPPVDL